jgi:hypothetical protein
MIQLTEALPYTIAALIAVTIIASAGAAISRWFNFKYVHLSFLSFTVYILIGYYISPISGLSAAILSSLVIGFYDATVGWKLSVLCKAKFDLSKEDLKKMTPSTTLAVMLFMAPLFAFIGHLLS